jgi:glycosyltransferase involved in cell wall biosynthesis
MSPNTPRASIGLPVFNAAASLGGAIDSLLAQTMTDFELVISDNASTDSTAEIARAYVERDSRIRYVRQTRNIGAFPNFAAVLREARGEYFMWAAADDQYAPSHLEDVVRELDGHPEAVAAMSATARHYADGKFLDEIRYDGARDPNRLSPLALGLRMATGIQYHLYIYGLYRRDFLNAAISSILPVRNADRLFIWRIALGHSLRYTGKTTYFRHVSDVPAQMRYRTSDPSLAKLYKSHAAYVWTVLRAIPYLLSAPRASLSVRAVVPIMILRYAKFLVGSVLGEMHAAARARAQQGS